MFARWVSIVQWESGTRDRAAAAVWRAESGTCAWSGDEEEEEEEEEEEAGLLVGMYSGREIRVVKKVELRSMNSSAVV